MPRKGFTVSAETDIWLNTQTLIGNTKNRGNAWHYREDLQGDEPNHYEEFIPLEDVNRRLFNFTVDEREMFLAPPSAGKAYIAIPGRKAMVRSDNGVVLGIFKEGYTGHSYSEWLLSNVATIIDDDLGISSAGLLKQGGQAWVEVSIPESITTPEGVEFRPNLLAATSFDGSLATSYGRKVQATVCDNTLNVALGESGQSFKLRHTKYSGLRIADAREALAIVHTMADDFAAEVARLTSWKVSDEQFDKLVNVILPMPESKSGKTITEKKQSEILTLYRSDERAATWNGTAFGVLQAFNTWNHHFAQVRKGTPRVLRNYENVLKGKFGEADNLVLSKLAEVTEHDPVVSSV